MLFALIFLFLFFLFCSAAIVIANAFEVHYFIHFV